MNTIMIGLTLIAMACGIIGGVIRDERLLGVAVVLICAVILLPHTH